MSRNEWLEVQAGFGAWLKAAHVVITLCGMLATLISPASLTWKLATIALLVAVSLVLYVRSVRLQPTQLLRLHQDGTARLIRPPGQSIDAIRLENGWAGHFFSMVTLREAANGRKRHCLVCRPENRADSYRQLLVLLRMRPATKDSHRMIWS